MARTAIPLTASASWGGGTGDITYTAGDAANDHQFANNGRELLLVKNGSGGGIAISIPRVANYRTTEVTTASGATVGATKEQVFGPFDPAVFNQSGGVVHVDITTDTSLEFAVISLPKPTV
jgi:hypothetical protein